MKELALGIFLFFLLGFSSRAAADESVYSFNCKNSNITSWIKYSVVGRYQARFDRCSGAIRYDEAQNEIKAVQIEIITDSIVSNCQWCDKIVLSPQIMDAKRYPSIVFGSKSFGKTATEHWVLGRLDLHGQTDNLKIPFSIQKVDAIGNHPSYLQVKGQFAIPRKKFGIIWNKVLDQGGVMVGNYINVDCDIKIQK